MDKTYFKSSRTCDDSDSFSVCGLVSDCDRKFMSDFTAGPSLIGIYNKTHFS